MKKRNVILHTAIASALLTMAGVSSAGTLATTFKTYASEVFGAGSAATAITPTPITYQFGVPVAANQVVSFYVKLSGGAKFVAGKVAPADLTCLDAASVAMTSITAAPKGVIVSGAPSTDGTYAVFSVNTGASGLNTNSTCTYIPQAASVDNANVALSASGGVITSTWTNDTAAVSLAAVPTGGTNFDTAGTHVGNIAQSAAAITATYIASSAFPFTPVGGAATGAAETKKINVAATPTAALFTVGSNGAATNTVNLGALLFAETAGIQDNGAGADYSILTKATATGLSAVITGDFSLAEAAAASKGVFLATDLACTAQIVAPAAGAVTYNTGKTTATISGGTRPTVNVPMYVCMTVKPTNTTAITPTAYSATASLAKTAATELATVVASTPLLATALNGSTVDVRSYIPAATVGYTSFVRVINTGSVTAPVTGVWLYENGTVGTYGTLIASLTAGGSTTLSSAQVEAALGAPTVIGGNRPRLRVAAATNALQAQSFFLTNANGNFSDVTGAQ